MWLSRYNRFCCKQILFLCITFSSISGWSQQNYLVKQNGEKVFGKISYKNCSGKADPSVCFRVKSNSGLDLTYHGEEVDYFNIGEDKYIVRKIFSDSIFRVYHVLLDGTVQVIDLGFSFDDNQVAAVVLRSGLIMPVTKKLYEKWILPEFLKKESFKEWYDKNEVLKFPKRKKDRLGGRKQRKINEFIIKLTIIYNRLP